MNQTFFVWYDDEFDVKCIYTIDTYFVLRVYVELWRVDINNNIISVVQYEYVEYFKL